METEAPGIVSVETFPARVGHARGDIPLQEGMTLDDLLVSLEIPADTEAVMVNGVYVRPDYVLRAGDRVRIIPFLSGG